MSDFDIIVQTIRTGGKINSTVDLCKMVIPEYVRLGNVLKPGYHQKLMSFFDRLLSTEMTTDDDVDILFDFLENIISAWRNIRDILFTVGFKLHNHRIMKKLNVNPGHKPVLQKIDPNDFWEDGMQYISRRNGVVTYINDNQLENIPDKYLVKLCIDRKINSINYFDALCEKYGFTSAIVRAIEYGIQFRLSIAYTKFSHIAKSILEMKPKLLRDTLHKLSQINLGASTKIATLYASVMETYPVSMIDFVKNTFMSYSDLTTAIRLLEKISAEKIILYDFPVPIIEKFIEHFSKKRGTFYLEDKIKGVEKLGNHYGDRIIIDLKKYGLDKKINFTTTVVKHILYNRAIPLYYYRDEKIHMSYFEAFNDEEAGRLMNECIFQGMYIAGDSDYDERFEKLRWARTAKYLDCFKPGIKVRAFADIIILTPDRNDY